MDLSRFDTPVPDYYGCDKCDKPCGDDFYHFTSGNESGDLCAKCFPNWLEAFTPVKDTSYSYCDVCQQGLTAPA